ncbi:MAG: YfiR family protein [Planctomycetes bacterium]|nr:YfiR family protein [Planctomycetota bacterium]
MRRPPKLPTDRRRGGRAQFFVVLLMITIGALPGATRERDGAGPRSAADEQSKQVSEWDLRAVWLYKFASYIKWPKERLPEDKSPLVIGVLGRDPFGKTLDATLKDKKLGSHPIEIQRFDDAEKAAASHLLYVSTTDPDEIDEILTTLRGKPIVLVGDGPTFTKHGGMISFKRDGRRMTFTVNVHSLKAAGLEASSELLKHAVKDETEAEK